MSLLAAGRISRQGLARRIADGFDAGSVLLVAGAGYGKTMALEEALELSGRTSAWLACGEARGDPARLLTSAVHGLRGAVPGLVDVLDDALSGSLQQLDPESATSALLAELEHLLVEPLVVVLDDAEELHGSEAAMAMLDQLLGVRGVPLSLAIASRQPLPLRLSKQRAAGRLLELGPAELGFSAGECAELLRQRHGESIAEEDIEAVIAASEGWPMGVALARPDGSSGPKVGATRREDLFRYLAEEVFDRLDQDTRLMLADSSVVDALTPELARDLGLPPDVDEVAEAAGLPVRTRASGSRAYHPLILGFLRGRLGELRTESELASLHERAGDSLASAGQPAAAIEHWLDAGRFERALAAMASDGAGLVRSSPETVSRWLSTMPDEVRAEPGYQLLQGQLLWGGGDHERAVQPLRAAISGFRETGNADGEWMARVYLADTLVFIGEFEEVESLTDGWEEASGPLADAASSSVAWYQVIALAALGRIDQAERLKEELREDSRTARLFGFLDAITSAGTALARGDIEAAFGYLKAEIEELEVHDPLGSLPYVMGMLLATRRNLGERRDALEWVERCEREAERVGLGFALRDFRLQRATLLAQAGDLGRAEAVLAQATKRGGTGWREVFDAEAEAQISMLRGDGGAAVEAARRALRAARTAPITWRVLTTVEMTELLARTGAPETASAAIEATLGWLDERFPGDLGRLPRAWLLASSASLHHRAGEPETAARTLGEAWDAAGDAAAAMLRARWQSVQPVLWQALAEGSIPPERVVPAMQEAFPAGEALAALSDHTDPAVRRAAVLSGLAASHPDTLAHLAELTEDSDGRIAAAATAASEELKRESPPLRFELLGRFRVLRAGWELDEESWKRPISARVVRFLLVRESRAVPEDELFEAFWPDKTPQQARQNLAAAVSRARKVLDLPGAPESVIELRERTYRLRLGERDSTDVAEFETAARAALAERGEGRLALLEHAAALWLGEPLPEDRYAEWSFGWREDLIETYSSLLGALVGSYVASGDRHEAIRAARRLLEMDPLNEDAHRQLMVTYARTGRTSQALRQFLECRRALVVEMGVEPSKQTAELQARILAGEPV